MITVGQSSKPALPLIVKLDWLAEVGEQIEAHVREAADSEVLNATSRVGIVEGMASFKRSRQQRRESEQMCLLLDRQKDVR